mgnify:FL=1
MALIRPDWSGSLMQNARTSVPSHTTVSPRLTTWRWVNVLFRHSTMLVCTSMLSLYVAGWIAITKTNRYRINHYSCHETFLRNTRLFSKTHQYGCTSLPSSRCPNHPNA